MIYNRLITRRDIMGMAAASPTFSGGGTTQNLCGPRFDSFQLPLTQRKQASSASLPAFTAKRRYIAGAR